MENSKKNVFGYIGLLRKGHNFSGQAVYGVQNWFTAIFGLKRRRIFMKISVNLGHFAFFQ
jgi:hypothetical protein